MTRSTLTSEQEQMVDLAAREYYGGEEELRRILRDLVARVTEQTKRDFEPPYYVVDYRMAKERVALLEGLLKKSRLYVQRQQHHAATANARQDACFVVAEIDAALNGGPDAE
jgi:hypothetical protein